jgi:Family of unknown function (DUF6152)
MTHRHASRAVLGIGLMLVGAITVAHHGQAGLFDEDRIVELSGAVREWSFVNPHPVLVIEVVDADGSAAAWDVYFGPAAVSALRRRGFTAETFMIGETVIVKGHPATARGAHGIDVWGGGTSILRADGATIP